MRFPYFERRLKQYYTQFLAATAATTLMLEVGIICGWSSPYLARLEAPNSTLPLTREQSSWVASLSAPGRIIGSVVGFYSVNYVGSKCTLLFAALPILCSWIFIMCAKSPGLLYIGRMCGGMFIGMTYCSLSLYVGEVALPEIRGAIMSAAIAGGVSVGIVVSSICGSYLSLSSSATIYSIPCVLVIILLSQLPETPHWLVKNNDNEGAKRSIIWYQPTIDPDIELSIVRKLVTSSTSETFHQQFLKCLEPGPIRKALILVVILFVFAQLSGMINVVFHMENIFIHSKLKIIKPSIMVIYVNMVSIVTTFFAIYLIDKFGRRFLLTLSCVGIFVSMLGLGFDSYLVDMNPNGSDFQWLAIISVFSYMAFYFIGMMSVPNTILGEMFPSDVKSVAALIGTLSAATSAFMCTKSYQPLVDLIGEAYVFWIHGTFALVLVPYIRFYLLETKGKSLAYIQNQLMSR